MKKNSISFKKISFNQHIDYWTRYVGYLDTEYANHRQIPVRDINTKVFKK